VSFRVFIAANRKGEFSEGDYMQWKGDTFNGIRATANTWLFQYLNFT